MKIFILNIIFCLCTNLHAMNSNHNSLISVSFFRVNVKKTPVYILKTYSPSNLKMGTAFGHKIKLPKNGIIYANMEDDEIIEALFTAYPGQKVSKKTGFIHRKLYDKIFPNFLSDETLFSRNRQ